MRAWNVDRAAVDLSGMEWSHVTQENATHPEHEERSSECL